MDPSELGWTEDDWKAINGAVLQEVGRGRVGQKIFPTTVVAGDPNQIDDEKIDFATMSIAEGATKPFVELHREFTLTSTQVKQEATQGTAKTLARMVAKAIALSEDQYIFQDSTSTARTGTAIPSLLAPPINVDNWRTSLDLGLLEAANPATASDTVTAEVSAPIVVATAGGGSGRTAAATGAVTWGENTFTAISAGVAKLVSKGQGPPFALVLSTKAYADAFAPPSSASLVTTADRIKPLVDGGFYSSGVLPEKEGLLVALAGEPIKLYVGREACVEYLNKNGGKFTFRVVERVQYVVRDPRAMVLLTFA